MNLLFLTSGSGKIFDFIFKDKIISTKNIYLYGDFRAGCKKIANKKGIKILGTFKKKFVSEILLKICKKYKIDYLLLYSFTHKLKGKVLKKYKNRIFNSHHSLLPAFQGKYYKDQVRQKYGPRKIFERCIDYGLNLTGNTIHLVDKNIDGGQPIVQSILVFDNNSKERSRNELFKHEYKSLKQFIIWLKRKKVVLKYSKIGKKKKFMIKGGKYKLSEKNPFVPNLEY